jgi:uncharacterized membrane protein
MKSSVRAAAAAVFSAVSTVALASEGPEGLGDMHGVAPLLYLVGGVAAMAVVIWLMLKFMNRKG